MDSFCGVADLKEEESSASKIGCNAVVLLSIARASDFSTLKSLRQVDSFWAQAVSRVFTQRASVNLAPGEKSLESLRSFKKETKGMEGKLKVLKIQCPSLNKLEEEEAGDFNDILQHLSTSLETLELAPQNFNFLTLFYPRIESKAQFPVLRTLVLDNHDYDILELVPKLFDATPALENLTLSHLGENHYDADFSFVLSPLQITGEDNGSIRRNWELAPNLRSLTFNNSLTPSEAEALGAFPQAWQALEVSWDSRDEPDRQLAALEQLLEKNKDSLRCLTLNDFCHAELQAKVQFQFPRSFSNLRLLRFYFEGSTFDHITFSFGTCKDLGEYAKMCPSLERVRIIVINLEVKTELKGFWSKFFPQTLSREGGKCLNWFVEREKSEGKEVLVATRAKGWGSF